MTDIATECSLDGMNVVMFNHFAVPYEQGIRFMDMALNKYLDEAIEYTYNRYQGNVDIYLAGYSMGGNYILAYLGRSASNQHHNTVERNDHSHLVKAAITLSSPFDVLTTIVNV